MAFFKKWLQRGDLSKLALEHNYSYRYLQAVKLGYKRSQAVEKLLLDTCLENRAKADNKNRMLN